MTSLNTRGPAIRIAKLNKQIRELRKALEFYADEKQYRKDWITHKMCPGLSATDFSEPVMLDNGNLAREALRKK